jgi:hypothetical protein
MRFPKEHIVAQKFRLRILMQGMRAVAFKIKIQVTFSN